MNVHMFQEQSHDARSSVESTVYMFECILNIVLETFIFYLPLQAQTFSDCSYHEPRSISAAAEAVSETFIGRHKSMPI